jgi:hypothetical protein
MSSRQFPLTSVDESSELEPLLSKRELDGLLDADGSNNGGNKANESGHGRCATCFRTHKKKKIAAIVCAASLVLLAAMLGTLGLLYAQVQNATLISLQAEIRSLCDDKNQFQVGHIEVVES